MVDRKLTGAHYGLRDWLIQRITAVVMLVYTVAFIIVLFALPKEYGAWQAFFNQVWVKVFTQITFVAVAMHVWIGVRDVWMDYVKPVGLRLTLHTLTVLWLLGVFIYSIKVVWGV